MGREFKNTDLNLITNSLKEYVSRMNYVGDISDLGNEIGITIGHTYPDLTEDEIKDFIRGFKHGVSLTNGKHT